MQSITIGILAGSGWILALHTWTKPSFRILIPMISIP